MALLLMSVHTWLRTFVRLNVCAVCVHVYVCVFHVAGPVRYAYVRLRWQCVPTSHTQVLIRWIILEGFGVRNLPQEHPLLLARPAQFPEMACSFVSGMAPCFAVDISRSVCLDVFVCVCVSLCELLHC